MGNEINNKFDKYSDIAAVAVVLSGIIGVILGVAICALAVFAA